MIHSPPKILVVFDTASTMQSLNLNAQYLLDLLSYAYYCTAAATCFDIINLLLNKNTTCILLICVSIPIKETVRILKCFTVALTLSTIRNLRQSDYYIYKLRF